VYATLWALRFPASGDYFHGCAWTTVLAQGVPDHVGTEGADDPYTSFLPSLEGACAGGLRAVVFVRLGAYKGTARSPQEHADPLLTVTGTAYESIPFADLHTRLCDALRGDAPRPLGERWRPDGMVEVIFEDGSVRVVQAAV
jgi:hypothetical protein